MQRFFIAVCFLATVFDGVATMLGLCVAAKVKYIPGYVFSGMGALIVLALLASTRDIWRRPDTTLKREKERLGKTHSSYWNEPAKEFISGLESAGNVQTNGNPKEIATLVHKVGTNRLMTRKTVSFAFAEHYEFASCLLGNLRLELSNNPSLSSDENWWSTKCDPYPF